MKFVNITIKNGIPKVCLLAMLDYVSDENDIPLCTQYNDMRKMKLKTILYPASVLVAAKVSNNNKIKTQSVKDSIPEFIRFNIVETDVRNII